MELPSVEELLNNVIYPWSLKLAAALAIFIIGRWVGKLLLRLVRVAMQKTDMDQMLIDFLSSIMNALFLLVIVVAALSSLGLNTTSLVALLGAAGLAIGLALQDSLKNFAAGVMMMIFRPFEDGDYVEAAGIAGTVLRINVFETILKTLDNRKIIVPNADIIANAIVNYSAHDTRRIDLVMTIGYDDDIAAARKAIAAVLEANDNVLDDPAPFIGVIDLADSSVNLAVRPWCRTSDYFSTSCELREQLKLAMDSAGISIPYPQMDVHMDSMPAQAA